MENNTDNTSNKKLVPISIIVAGAMIAGAIYFGKTTNDRQPTTDNRESVSQIELPRITGADYIFGNPEAEIKIVEYADTECPFCKNFHYTMKQVIDNYGGKVAWVYRHFPIEELHKRAQKEAEALECAAELGGNQIFWNYLDKIFEKTNSNDTLDPAELPKIAASLGLDVSQFNSCLSGGKYAQKVNDSVEEAIKAGARGTPYSVIVSRDNKKVVINGAESLAKVKAKVDALLEN